MSTVVPFPYPNTPDDDRRFFTAHPDRNYRVRPAGPGEAPDFTWMSPRGQAYIAVRRVAPGIRIRLCFCGSGLRPNLSEREARRLYELSLEANEQHRIIDRQATLTFTKAEARR